MSMNDKSELNADSGVDKSFQAVELAGVAEPSPTERNAGNQSLDMVKNVAVELTAVLGGASMTVGELYALKEKSVIKLDSLVDEPVDLLLDDKLVARGVLVVDDDHFGVQISELSQA